MSTTPWEKDEKKNKGAEPTSLIFDEIGQNKFFSQQVFKYEVKSYPDGSKYVILLTWGPRLTFKINNYEDLWVLGQINDILHHKDLNTELIIPNLIDAQADRRFDKNQSSGLKLVCKFLNGLKQFSKIRIFHPHNPEVIEALIDRVEIIDNYEFIKLVLIHLPLTYGGGMPKGTILMSSDAGGFKPLMKLADKIDWKSETFSASKSRKYEEGHTKLIQSIDKQDFEGKDILIIDDICVYGGTFKGLSKMLKERNCGRLYLAVSHMTIQNLGDNPVNEYFDYIFTTNSKFDTYGLPMDIPTETGMTSALFSPTNIKVFNLF